MASLNSYQNTTIIINTTTLLIIVVVLHHMLYPVSCFNEEKPATSPRDMLFEEKNRLGSVPPSCHNKCNGCHPCMAVEAPTLPSSHGRVQPGLTRTAAMDGFFLRDNRYSNYKPLGWKCRCGDHFFNP